MTKTMKQLLILISLLASACWAQGPLVHKSTAMSIASGMPATITATSSGNALVLAIDINGNNTVASVTGCTTSWTQVPSAYSVSLGGGADVWTNGSPAAGCTSVTVTTSGNAYSITAYELSGRDNSNLADQVATLSHQTGVPNPSGPAVTTSTAGEFIISILTQNMSDVTAISSPWTFDLHDAGWGPGFGSYAASGTGTFTPSWTTSGTGEFGGTTVSIRPAAAGPSITITSPTASQNINTSATTFTFKAAIASYPNTCAVQFLVNGEPAASYDLGWVPFYGSGTVSYTWNPNNFWNSAGATHWVEALDYDCIGNLLATSAPVSFQVASDYGEAASYMTISSITPSTAISSNWSGTVTISATLGGTNASNTCIGYGYIDGDSRNQTITCGSSAASWALDTTKLYNGRHLVTMILRDSGTANFWNTGGGGGFPIGLWEQDINIANTATNPIELWVSPKEAVIAPTNTLTLSCLGARADGSTTSPTCAYTVHTGYTGNCSVGSSSGIVTGTAFGLCQIDVTASGYPTRSIFEYISSTNVVPHFETNDGQIHTTDDGHSIWFASAFTQNNRTGFLNNAYRGGGDPSLASDALFGNPYSLAGFNAMEGSISGNDSNANNNYCGDGVISEATWDANVASYVSAQLASFSPWNLWFHGIGTNLMQNTDGSGNSVLYDCTSGFGRNYTTHAWAYLASQWQGHALGLEGPDEVPYTHPLPTPTIGMDGFTSITCTTGTTWTLNYTNIPHWGGSGYSFWIRGATTNSILNVTPTTAHSQTNMYTGTLVNANQMTFTGPSCPVNPTTVNSSSDPALVYEPFSTQWENVPGGGTTGTPSTAFSRQFSDLRTASPHPMFTSPVISGASAYQQYSWMGDPNTSDYAVCFVSEDAQAYNQHPQHRLLPTLTSDGTGNGTDIGDYCRFMWGRMQAPRGWLAEIHGTQFYGLQGASRAITSITGKTVTFSAAHGITNVIPNCGTRMAISGSSNSYFNKNWCITAAPSATTVEIATATASSVPANYSGSVTVTWANGDTSTFTALTYDGVHPTTAGGIGAYTPFDNCKHRGMTFTVSATGTPNPAAYWSSNTFYYVTAPATNASYFPLCFSSGQYDGWLEVPPIGQTSGSATASLQADSTYVRGRNWNGTETLYGSANAVANTLYSALLGASGGRLYLLGANNNFILPEANGTIQLGSGSLFGDTTGNGQSGDSPLYQNGDVGNKWEFQALTNANKVLNRFAVTGYLYQPRFGCPDYGFYIECTLRKGTKGNLLMFEQFADTSPLYPTTRTVDISSCAIGGQPTIKYLVGRRSIKISTINAGTTTDNLSLNQGNAVIYLCSNNAAAEYSPIPFSVRIADTPNADTIVVQYAAATYLLGLDPTAIVQSASGQGTVNIPWDANIGTLYYRILSLKNDGTLLSMGDVQYR